MSTVPPPKIKEFPPSSLEKIAYNSVSSIPTREPNDQFRLGYCVWRFLSERHGTLKEAIRSSGARVLIPPDDVYRIIANALTQAGITVE